MRKILLVLLISAFWGGVASAQLGCGGGRYMEEIFPAADVTSDITYGSNINLQGSTQSLELDVYEPQGDTEPLRPLLVMAHGGSFIGGSKDQSDIVSVVTPLAKMGYVCASIEYRLGMEGLPFPGPDSSTATEAVVRSYHDMKAAIRFFYKSAQNGNPYRIDTNAIYAGGVSAGAFTALHVGYLDDINEIPAYVDTSQAGLGGGIEGNSGNPGYSSRIQGVINICGALGDTTWMEPGDVPVVSLHGTADQVVPYGTAMITVVGVFPIMVVDGSHSVHEKANMIGLDNCFYTYQGADHVPHVGSAAYLDTTLNVITNFMYGLVCGGSGQCGYIVSAEDAAPAQAVVNVFPNPASNRLTLRAEGLVSGEVTLLDMNGRTVHSSKLQAGQDLIIDRNGLPAGMYLLRISAENEVLTKKVVFE